MNKIRKVDFILFSFTFLFSRLDPSDHVIQQTPASFHSIRLSSVRIFCSTYIFEPKSLWVNIRVGRATSLILSRLNFFRWHSVELFRTKHETRAALLRHSERWRLRSYESIKDHSRVHHGCSAGDASACVDVPEGAALFQRREPGVLFETYLKTMSAAQFQESFAVVTADRTHSKGIVAPNLNFTLLLTMSIRAVMIYFFSDPHSRSSQWHRGQVLKCKITKKDRRNAPRLVSFEMVT